MPPKSKKQQENTKVISPAKSDTDSIDIEQDPNSNIEDTVKYNVQTTQVNSLRDLKQFLSDTNQINPKNDPTTNFVDRMTGTSYKIHDKKVPKLFSLIQKCQDDGVKLMITELQKDNSTFMIDLDIYQDESQEQITDQIIDLLCRRISQLLMETGYFEGCKASVPAVTSVPVPPKKISIWFGVIRKPKIVFIEEKNCYKDGLHLIVSCRMNKNYKKFILEKLAEDAENLFADIVPTKNKIDGKDYARINFIDKNSAHVPVHLVGCPTKPGTRPYKLTHIIENSINIERNTQYPIQKLSDYLNMTGMTGMTNLSNMSNTKQFNIPYEFSINWEVPDGYIKKITVEPNEETIKILINKYSRNNSADRISAEDEEIERNYGILSTNAIHDVRIREIRDLLDTISPQRAVDYERWFEVLCVLANTSPSYKDLGEYFSRKCPQKFDMSSFETTWASICDGRTNNRKKYNLGSLHYWAKLDNPERYAHIQKQHIYHMLYNMVYESHKEGLLSHADIAKLLYSILEYKFAVDSAEGETRRYWYEFIVDTDYHLDGEVYKWYKWNDHPTTLSNYISDSLPNLFEEVLTRVIKNCDTASEGPLLKYYCKVASNFKATMRKLGDRAFKKNVIAEAEDKFYRRGFADSLDKDPLVRGVGNGVLRLSTNPTGKALLIQGYHSFNISKFTKTPYIPFNPHDPMTKDLILTLRQIIPDNERDTFEFLMHYFASTIDSNPKDSLFLIAMGLGANAKSFWTELHKATIGDAYIVKMNVSYLTSKTTNADNATPALMQTQFASLAYYSESGKNEVINSSRIKEMTGQETMSGRRLRQEYINFKPRCHHLVLTNNELEMGDSGSDYAIWRRILFVPFKMTFVSANDPNLKYDPNNPYHRQAREDLIRNWPDNTEIRGRYYGMLVYFYHSLYAKYGGSVMKVPHEHIAYETRKYQMRQNTIMQFVTLRFIAMSDSSVQVSIDEEMHKYLKWYNANHNGDLKSTKGLKEQFMNVPEFNKRVIKTKRGDYLLGHKFLADKETLQEDEKFIFKEGMMQYELPDDNFGIKKETPEEYYESLCREFDAKAHLFDNKVQYQADANVIRTVQEASANVQIGQARPRKNNLCTIDFELPEPTNVLNPYENELDIVAFANELVSELL